MEQTLLPTIDIAMEIRATPQRVFEAWTDPKQLATWWGEEGLYQVTDCDFDLRVGGHWRSNGVDRDGERFHVEGEYLVVDQPNALSFTWNKSWLEEPTTVVVLEFERTKHGTMLKIRHSGFTVPESQQSHKDGWPKVIGWLQAFVEGETK